MHPAKVQKRFDLQTEFPNHFVAVTERESITSQEGMGHEHNPGDVLAPRIPHLGQPWFGWNVPGYAGTFSLPLADVAKVVIFRLDLSSVPPCRTNVEQTTTATSFRSKLLQTVA